MKHWMAVAALLPVAWGMPARAAGPELADFLRKPQYESMVLSPGGDFVAARVPFARVGKVEVRPLMHEAPGNP